MTGRKKIRIQLEIVHDIPDIESDELKVKEILYKLLSNAVISTPEGGEIGMRVKNIHAAVEVEVWDTGVGIASEYMDNIFEGFFRADTPYFRRTEGAGLGYRCKKHRELHGGTFSLRSEGLGKGTTARFTLPVVSKQALKNEP